MDRVENVCSGGEHEGVATNDSPIAILKTPVVEVLTDIPATVVDVDTYDGQRKDWTDVEQTWIVVPDFQIPHHQDTDCLHQSALSDWLRIGKMDEMQKHSDKVRDGKGKEEGLQEVVDYGQRPGCQIFLEEVIDVGEEVECLHFSKY